MRPFCVFAAVGVLVVAGCGGDDSGSEEPSTTVAEEETALPEAIPVEGAPTVDIEDRLIREIKVDEGPGWLLSAFGSLWVKEDHGEVLRVDTESGDILAEIPDGDWAQPICQGLGASEDAIWSCPREGVVARIDPKTESLEQTLRIDKTVDQTRLPSVNGQLWVLTDGGETLTPIDTETNKPGPAIDLGSACADVTASEDELWVSCYVDNRVLRIDPATGEIVTEIELDRPRTIALGEDLWVGTELGVAQLEPESLEVIALYDAYPGVDGAIFAGTDDVWIRESHPAPFLTRIDPDAHEVVETIEAPKLKTGGDVIVIGESVWASAYDDLALVELQAP